MHWCEIEGDRIARRYEGQGEMFVCRWGGAVCISASRFVPPPAIDPTHLPTHLIVAALIPVWLRPSFQWHHHAMPRIHHPSTLDALVRPLAGMAAWIAPGSRMWWGGPGATGAMHAHGKAGCRTRWLTTTSP